MTTYRSYFEVKKALQKKRTTCLEITQNYLNRIAKNSHLNAFVEVYSDESLFQAKQVDKKISKGKKVTIF